VDTGIRFATIFPNAEEPLPEMSWNLAGTLLAIPNPNPNDGRYVVLFYQPNGALLHAMPLPGGERALSLSWYTFDLQTCRFCREVFMLIPSCAHNIGVIHYHY
jgi:hypothetical protein